MCDQAGLNSSRLVRLCLCLLLMALSVCGFAADGSIEAKFFPESAVADGVSRIAITVTVRDRNGNLVSNGTQVLFETSLGGLTQSQVATVDGIARTNLVAGTLPGISQITVSVLQFRASARFPVRLVRSREELRQASRTLEIVGPKRLTFSPTSNLIRVDGPERKALVRYGNTTVNANDLQLNVGTLELRGREVTLQIGSERYDFQTLQYDLRQQSGMGVLRRKELRTFVEGAYPVPKVTRLEELRPALVQIAMGVPSAPMPGGFNQPVFEFQDIYADTTLVYARRATVILGRETLLQDAVLDVNGTKVLTVPKFRISQQQQSEVITDEFIQVSNNQLAVNFPYYLQLGAGDDAALRFRYGNRFSRGVGGGGGIFLDFEKNWSQSDETRGGLAFRGIGRDDWGLNLSQTVRLSPRSRASVQLDLSRWDSLFGNAFFEHSLQDWLLTYSGSSSRTLRGSSFSSSDQAIAVNQRPKRVAGLPVSISTGVSYNIRSSRSESSKRRTEYTALDLLGTFDTVRIGQSVLTSSGRLSRLEGHNIREGWTSSFNANLSGNYGPALSTVFGYDYSDDSFSASLLGRHRVNTVLAYDAGRTYISLYGSKSLDQSRYSLQGDASYRIGSLWRVGGNYTVEGFAGSSFSDSSAVIAYRLGFREVGLSFSLRTRRIGLEILGTPLR